ncbi:GlcG/HbpS family heme-binding protein [Rhodococcus erythropolis]
MGIDLETARAIISGARLASASSEVKPLAIVVLDAGGHLVAAEREDGASMKRFEIAHGKAYGALALGVGSRTLMVRAEKQPHFVSAAAAAIGGALIPVPGGVLIRDTRGALVGAIGVSGDTSENDEEIALKGIAAGHLVSQVD